MITQEKIDALNKLVFRVFYYAMDDDFELVINGEEQVAVADQFHFAVAFLPGRAGGEYALRAYDSNCASTDIEFYPTMAEAVLALVAAQAKREAEDARDLLEVLK